MEIANTVTVVRGFAEGVAVYRVRLTYNDGDSQRGVEALLSGAVGDALFESVQRAGEYDLAGRADVLTSVVAEAVALGKPVPQVK
jgi:hypothetical protein